MNKDADRIKRWRERKKSEGKTSFTILLSQQARDILKEQKEKTGASYAAIIEQSLQALKRQHDRHPVRHQAAGESENGVLARPTARYSFRPAPPVTTRAPQDQPKILIDDLANYPTMADIERERAAREQVGFYDIKANEGLFTRLLRASTDPFARKKKWFR